MFSFHTHERFCYPDCYAKQCPTCGTPSDIIKKLQQPSCEKTEAWLSLQACASANAKEPKRSKRKGQIKTRVTSKDSTDQEESLIESFFPGKQRNTREIKMFKTDSAAASLCMSAGLCLQ